MDLDAAASAARNSGKFELEGVEFVLSEYFPAGSKDAFSLIKPRRAIQAYADLLRRHDQPRMIELGIAWGGSVAFLALAARPAKFVAIDIDDQPVESLARLIDSLRLGESVRPMYGIDQADRGRLREIVRDEFGDSALDIVIDDASHQYEQTVSSFETLFPYLRPGGEYIIEDWSCDHSIARLLTKSIEDPSSSTHDWAANLMAGKAPAPRDDQRPLGTVAAELLGAVRLHPDEDLPRPLSRLALELVLSAAESGDGIESVVINHEWIVMKRGLGELPDTFGLSDVCIDRFKSLA